MDGTGVQIILQEVWNQILLIKSTTMGKTITITNPEFKAAIIELNKYIAQELGCSYRPKRERSPQEKWKRYFKWGHRQDELKWMNEVLDYTIQPSVSDEQDPWGCKINLTITDKATGNVVEIKNISACCAYNKMVDYKRKAYDARREKRA